MISGTTRPISDKQIHHQLIAFAGAGKLLDGSPCSIEFRAFLASVGSRHLSAYVDQCLSESFDEVERLVAAATACLGRRYDLRNLFDLGRYLPPLPHLPVHWRRRALASRLAPLRAFVRRLTPYLKGIISHCRYPLHTSVLEGINNKIKVLKRIAFGYRSFRNFRIRILCTTNV